MATLKKRKSIKNYKRDTKVNVTTWHGKLKNPFAVPVPFPYFIEMPDDKTAARLLQECATLWKALDMLKISPAEAREKDYTLNIRTRDELYSKAMNERNSRVCRFINKHDWNKTF